MVGLKSLWTDPRWQFASYRRLAIAFALSLLLHLFLIGKFYFKLPDLNEGRHVIEARLVLSKPVEARSPVEAMPIIKQDVLPTPTPTPTPLPPEEALVEDVLSPPETLAPAEVVATPQPAALPPQSDDVVTNIESEVVDNRIEEAGLIVNKDPYRYVETEFDVYTDKEPLLSSSSAGKAKMLFQILPNGEQYQIKSLIQANGLAALFMPDLLQTSDGYLDRFGLQPVHYLYQFGDKKNKTFSADFDWESKKINLHSEKGDQKLALTEGTQDLLSFMYQFMFVAPLQNMQLNITNGKKIGVYDYSFEGEETLATKMGDIKTVHLLRTAAEGEKKTELWLALDYQYVPVKIRETEKEGKVYELLVTSLKAEFHAPPVP